MVLAALREVTNRSKVAAKLKLTPERVNAFLRTIESLAVVLEGFPETFEYQRDPDDAHYVNLALAAAARLIVSRDRDLLDLMDLSKPESVDFQQRFPTLRILDPVGFLREIAS